MMTKNIRIGIIGGSGLYAMEELTDAEHVSLETPFGAPSDAYVIGALENVRIAFLSRHGKGHRLSPSELNFRANIYGFKQLGVEHLISVTAVGSLKENILPLDIVIPDQLFDCTKERDSTFFGNGLVAHIAFADPMCPDLAKLIYKGGTQVGAPIHQGGTLLCIEGPAFSTRAESNAYRQWGMDIIGMTSLQEAKLAREAEICYAAIAMVTDFDCWHAEESEVNVETVVQNLNKNISFAKKIIQVVVPKISDKRECVCAQALKNAMMTEADTIPSPTRKKLELLVGKYLKA
ncbi:MAG: S-methyl-5'-thioadenosine phosphorylase [Desulfobacterales bacterium]|jgi:5'-methylthioadenosine phosphorylase